MSSTSFRSSNPDAWTRPRPYSDESFRRWAYGPIQPMEQPQGFFSRLLFGQR